jgi:hypothetical protein
MAIDSRRNALVPVDQWQMDMWVRSKLLVTREFGLLAGIVVKVFVFGQVKVATWFYPIHSKWETRDARMREAAFRR